VSRKQEHSLFFIEVDKELAKRVLCLQSFMPKPASRDVNSAMRCIHEVEQAWNLYNGLRQRNASSLSTPVVSIVCYKKTEKENQTSDV